MNRKQIVLLSVIISVIFVMIVVSIFFRKNVITVIDFLGNLVQFGLKQNIFLTLCIFTLIGFPFYILFLPGYTFIVVVSAYFIKDFIKTFFIFKLVGIVLSITAYLIFSSLKNRLIPWVEDEKIYKIFKNKTDKNQWKISYLIFMLYIPKAYKTIILVVLNVGFWQYVIPANVVNCVITALFISVGTSITTIQDLYTHNYKNQQDMRIVLMLITANFVIFLLVFIYMIVFAYTEYKLYEINYENEEQMNQKEIQLKDIEDKTQDEILDKRQQEEKIF